MILFSTAVSVNYWKKMFISLYFYLPLFFLHFWNSGFFVVFFYKESLYFCINQTFNRKNKSHASDLSTLTSSNIPGLPVPKGNI